MANHRVVLEIEIDADSPLEAAQKTQEMIKDPDTNWQYYIQKASKHDDEVYSVDLEEEPEDAEMVIDNYIPLIR